MTKRTIILGIIMVLVVVYGAWDIMESRSRRRSTRLLNGKGNASVSMLQNSQNKVAMASSPLSGRSAPGVGQTEARESMPRGEKALWFPMLADLTQLQRQRADAHWGRDPFIRAGLNQGGLPGSTPDGPERGDSAQTLSLNGVVRFGARRIAIINDKTYLPGDIVGGWRVEKIDPDQVIIKKQEERLTLVIHRLREVR
jgi:hypothetical protein